jgi:hypothetical protein
METDSSKPATRQKTARLVIRIVVSLVTLLYLLIFLPKIIQDILEGSSAGPPGDGWEGTMVTTGFLVFVLGYILSWWRGLFGGIIMIIAGIIMFATHMMSADGEFEFLPFLVFPAPMIICGILFIIFWLKKK